MYRSRHKTAAWVAIIAVVLNALWPLVAQFEPGKSAAMQMQSCAESGLHHAAVGEQGTAPVEPSPLMPHCGFCALAAGGFTVLVAHHFDAALPVKDAKESRRTVAEVRLPAIFSYSPAHPRAPPVIS